MTKFKELPQVIQDHFKSSKIFDYELFCAELENKYYNSCWLKLYNKDDGFDTNVLKYVEWNPNYPDEFHSCSINYVDLLNVIKADKHLFSTVQLAINQDKDNERGFTNDQRILLKSL